MGHDRPILTEYLAAKQAYVDATNHDLTAADVEVRDDQDRYVVALEAYIADLRATGDVLPEGLEYELASLRQQIARRGE